MFKKNKKAQISETITWIVATIVIIVTLIIFIYVSSILPKEQVSSKIDVDKEIDWLETKISLAHFQAQSKNKEIIDGWIKKENE